MNEKVQINLEIKGCSPEEKAFIYLAVTECLDAVMEFLEFKKSSVSFLEGDNNG